MTMTVQCELCPKGCVIGPGRSGECRVRINVDGKLVAATYARPCSVHVDPVEKKPLFHFLPGSGILSIATVGCNLHCRNCQNWEISQANPEEDPERHLRYYLPGERTPRRSLAPKDVPRVARHYRCRSVAYTYTDPMVYYEYALDSCIAAREAGLKNALVTAGYINEAPLRELCKHVDAANIDLKAFSEDFYRDVCDATLKPVLNALVVAKSMGVLVEVTNLVIPTLNDADDDIRGLSRWVARNMGKETPLHFSGFTPRYRMRHLPPTPAATLDRAKEIAKDEGLYYVYIGNVLRPDGGSTFCHKCGKLLVRRRGYHVPYNGIAAGACPHCGTEVFGLWK